MPTPTLPVTLVCLSGNNLVRSAYQSAVSSNRFEVLGHHNIESMGIYVVEIGSVGLEIRGIGWKFNDTNG